MLNHNEKFRCFSNKEGRTTKWQNVLLFSACRHTHSCSNGKEKNPQQQYLSFSFFFFFSFLCLIYTRRDQWRAINALTLASVTRALNISQPANLNLNSLRPPFYICATYIIVAAIYVDCICNLGVFITCCLWRLPSGGYQRQLTTRDWIHLFRLWWIEYPPRRKP
jgi:hypothetical protein